MTKQIPSEWVTGKKKSLNVAFDLGLRCPVTNLYVFKNKNKNSKFLQCRWMPDIDEDFRPEHLQRTKGGKRRYFEGSTGHTNPFEAGKYAIEWYKDIRKQMSGFVQEYEFNSGHSLHHFWDLFFDDFQNNFINKRGGNKRITNTKSYWYGEEIGICHQEFSRKSVDKITYSDLVEYWKVIDIRGKKIGSTMSETKKQVKTLLNKLIDEAKRSKNFPNLRSLEYPPIHTGERKEVSYMKKGEWDKLLLQVIELSNGNAHKLITREEFLNVDWSTRSTDNHRNWIDVYDALMMMWFFYLRAEDMPRIKVSWFSIRKDSDGEEYAHLNLEKAKGFRDLKESYAYRPDAVNALKRMLKRRDGDEYVVFNFYARPLNNENSSNVCEKLNELLRVACNQAFVKGYFKWTSIRHTAFMETCREFEDLRNPSELASFAKNAFTSTKTLQERYLNKIDVERSAKKARKKISKGTYTLVKRVK